jgi:hypothetical protein
MGRDGQREGWATAEIVTVRFEPCAAFDADALEGAGAPCATCGWLHDDHSPVAADASRAAA